MTPITFEISCREGARPVYLHLIKTDKFKTVRLSLTLSHPLTRESMIFDRLFIRSSLRATEKIPDILSANRILDDLYSATLSPIDRSVGAVARPGLCAEFLDGRYIPDGRCLLPEVADVMAEMLLRPKLTDRAIECERENLVLAVKDEINDPIGYAAIRGRALLFKGSPCGETLIGREDEIARVTPDEVRKYRDDLFSDARIDFFCIGNIDGGYLSDVIKRHFSGLGSMREPQLRTEIRLPGGQTRTETERMPVLQCQLQMGFSGGYTLSDPQYAASAVFAELFGNMGNSRLYQNLRETLGLCYSIDARYFSSAGAMAVECGTDECSAETARAGVLAQLDDIKRGNISERELSDAKKSLLAMYSVMADDQAETESFWSWNLLSGVSESPEDVCRRICDVTVSDVADAAGRFEYVSDYVLCPGTAEAANG